MNLFYFSDQGKMLVKQNEQEDHFSVILDWLRAIFIAAVLLPLHNLAKILIYKKIYQAIGIQKVSMIMGS